MKRSLGLLMVLLGPARAQGFSIGSSFTEPCHETITLSAFFKTVPLPASAATAEANPAATWVQVAEYFEKQLDYRFASDFERFVLVTLYIGVRYPDQAGFATTDLNSLRQIHMSAEDQEAHALRGLDDAGAAGDAAAIERTRDTIRATVEEAYALFQDSVGTGKQRIKDQTETVAFWLEYYGEIDVPVWKPLFLLGRAAHALQDSFPHTYRSADASAIYAVANFVEGLSSSHRESEDGPRHSDLLDKCFEDEISPLREAATLATSDLFAAVLTLFETGEDAKLDEALDVWLAYQPGCGYAEAYCDTPWAALAKSDETRSPLGCRAQLGSLWVLPVILLLRRNQIRARVTLPRPGRSC